MLERILDSLRKEAPESYKTYFPTEKNVEGLNKARSLAFIHLLLKVKFGVFDFLDRHKLITDGTQDGGLDAYFIDEERKKLFLIQSKFRNTPENFDEKMIDANDLIKMEVSRITKGQPDDSKGVNFNEKIKSFQESLRNIRDIAKYDFIVFFLGNVYNYSDQQIRRLIDNCNYEIYNADKAYEKLLFPLTTGT
ncbi:MAG: AIPR protein, partial [Proteobacteria bacterium]|nr:AIPR protein [Pseudomonadota bacterium]